MTRLEEIRARSEMAASIYRGLPIRYRTYLQNEKIEATAKDVPKLLAEVDRLTAERDAAVADIKALLMECECEHRHDYCKRGYEPNGCTSDNCNDAEWRGPQGGEG
ncbi:MAG: hypothetical protein FWF10_00535 [Clostridiales bacterium]|nr:hypothetical protein [Clostridiales bacterium]